MPSFTVRLDPDEHERLTNYAHVARVSMAGVVRAALRAYLAKHDTSSRARPVIRPHRERSS
jgi:predicted transcriptional regulator